MNEIKRIFTPFNPNNIFLCLLLHLSEQTNDMQATINAGMNNQKNMAITHTNIKSLTMSPKRHTERNNTQMYCIVIHNGLSVSFIVLNGHTAVITEEYNIEQEMSD